MPHFPDMEQHARDPDLAKVSTATASNVVSETPEARVARLRIKTRRRRYLEMNPKYFDSTNLELADPLLYDRMIRQFQSAAEREADGRQKGYSGALEADLSRAEAKIAALSHSDQNSPLVYKRDATGSITAVDQNEEDRPKSKAEGIEKWKECMEQRFLRGEDQDFDYTTIDANDQYDDWAEETRRTHDQYFDEEQAEFMGNGMQQAQTGVQDF